MQQKVWDNLFSVEEGDSIEADIQLSTSFEVSNDSIQKGLERMIDQALNRPIFLKDSKYTLTLVRNDDLQTKIKGRQIQYKLPLGLTLESNLAFANFIIKGSCLFHLNTHVDIKEDWEMVPMTSLVEYAWIVDPKLDIGIIDVPVKKLVNKVLDENIAFLVQALDSLIADKTDLKTIVSTLMDQIKHELNAIPVFKDNWNITTPLLLLSDLSSSESNTSGQVLIPFKLGYSNTSKESHQLLLPRFKWGNVQNKKTTVEGISQFSYASISSIIGLMTQNRQFEIANRSFSVLSAHIYEHDKALTLDLTLDGQIKGQTTIRGKPVVDAESKSIRIENLHVDLSTSKIIDHILFIILKRKIQRVMKDASIISMQKIQQHVDHALKSAFIKLISPERGRISFKNLGLTVNKLQPGLNTLDIDVSMWLEIECHLFPSEL